MKMVEINWNEMKWNEIYLSIYLSIVMTYSHMHSVSSVGHCVDCFGRWQLVYQGQLAGQITVKIDQIVIQAPPFAYALPLGHLCWVPMSSGAPWHMGELCFQGFQAESYTTKEQSTPREEVVVDKWVKHRTFTLLTGVYVTIL